MIGNNTNKIINELFSSLLTKYQINLGTSIKGSNFVFDSNDGMCWKCHRISLNRCGMYINYSDWIKTKN